MLALQLEGRRKPYLMAHRGNRVLCPENTLPAFRQAVEDGADIVETDLHLSADGEFVCIHDATLDRTTNGSGPVAERDLSELKGLSASYGKEGFEEARIPTLEELAGILPKEIALALELKTDRFLEPDVAKELLQRLTSERVRDRTIILSFSLARLRSIKEHDPTLGIGWITLRRLTPLQGPEMLGPLWPLLLLNPFYVTMAHRKGQLVCPLDPLPDPRLRLYKALGCDAVLSDNPKTTRQNLEQLESG